jgi:CPA1 family monovalent cation:H+ antiporter
MVARLMARGDRLVDAVRDRGTEGYQQTIRSFALPDRAFRLGLWLQRRFGIERVLTERLADRFEMLMVQQDVLAELASFNLQSISDLLGSDAEARAERGDPRAARAGRPFAACALLQYAGYAEAIRDRQLERAAIRLEAAEYARRLRESIIGREVYADLRQQLNKRRDAIADRPPLHLGLELAAMIARVPLFATLDEAAVAEVANRLRPVVALPDEKIIAAGGKPDSMYFIAAGEVTVVRQGSRIVLREGDFFGEQGLLGNRAAQCRRDLRRLLPPADAPSP